MQIHRCMPRPNNWTPASKYFKMPFSLLLIVFRPQCEETCQEHVGVAWRAMGPACPQPSSKAIKKVHYQTLYDSGSKHSVYSHHILRWYGCQLCHHLHMVKGKGALVFQFTVITFHTQPSSQKIDSIKAFSWRENSRFEWTLFIFTCSWGMYCMCVWGEMRNVCNGGDTLGVEAWKCGGSAEDRKAPHHLLLLSCPAGWQQRRPVCSVQVTCRATATWCLKRALCWSREGLNWHFYMYSYGYTIVKKLL